MTNVNGLWPMSKSNGLVFYTRKENAVCLNIITFVVHIKSVNASTSEFK